MYEVIERGFRFHSHLLVVPILSPEVQGPGRVCDGIRETNDMSLTSPVMWTQKKNWGLESRSGYHTKNEEYVKQKIEHNDMSNVEHCSSLESTGLDLTPDIPQVINLDHYLVRKIAITRLLNRTDCWWMVVDGKKVRDVSNPNHMQSTGSPVHW